MIYKHVLLNYPRRQSDLEFEFLFVWPIWDCRRGLGLEQTWMACFLEQV